MTMKDILSELDKSLLSEICTIDYISRLKSLKHTLTKSDKRLLLRHMSCFRKLGPETTLKRILLYSFWCPDEAIESARKKGVFRYKAWGLNKNCAETILLMLKAQSQIVQYSNESCHFIDAKLKLSWMFSFYKKTEEDLIKYIQNHHKDRKRLKVGSIIIEEALFKELLAYVDCRFYVHKRTYNENHLNKNLFTSYSDEEISDSISYLIFLYDSVIGIKDDTYYLADPTYIVSDEIEKIILLGCKIHELQEWEICIDYFNYQVKSVDNNFTIFDSEGTFEKSIRLGYVRRDMQEAIYYNEFQKSPEEIASLADICTDTRKKIGSKLMSSVGSGASSRFRFEIPEPLFDLFEKNGTLGTGLFKEEFLSVGHCAKEFVMTIDDALKKKITKSCTLLDVVMFQRFFIFINSLVAELLFAQKDKMKIIRSLIPTFREENLKNLLSKFLGSHQKSKELIDLFTYHKDIKLDLQYTPLLKASGEIVFSTNLTSKSNLIRNCIAASYLLKNQIVNDDESEPLVLECKNAFMLTHPEYQVFTNKRFSYLNQEGEIDVLVISKTDIIVIECKCPLSPTNNFEMRASVDHIEKAARQLSHSKLAISDDSFRRNFFRNMKIEDLPRKIHTCIVFGNRLFNGYTIDSHPVRYIRELQMILNNGHIYSDAGNWRVWENEEYTQGDLIKFLSSTYTMGTANFNGMDKVEQFMFIKGKKVVFETYAFNFIKTLKHYDNSFTIETTNDELRAYIKSKE